MKKQCRICLVIFTSIIVFLNTTAISQEVTGHLNFELPVPVNQDDKSYLGLNGQDTFSLNQIDADIVIIEIFSMYCPICQREAEDVNALFTLIQSDSNLKDGIRLIGIGAGNSDFEVKFFKEKYDIQFPLFSDGQFIIHKQIGEYRTPHFFGLKKSKSNQMIPFYSKSGEISDPQAFLNALIDASKMAGNP